MNLESERLLYAPEFQSFIPICTQKQFEIARTRFQKCIAVLKELIPCCPVPYLLFVDSALISLKKLSSQPTDVLIRSLSLDFDRTDLHQLPERLHTALTCARDLLLDDNADVSLRDFSSFIGRTLPTVQGELFTSILTGAKKENQVENFVKLLSLFAENSGGSPFDGMKICDVGAGKGYLSLALSSLGAQVTAVEGSANNVQSGQARVAKFSATLKRSDPSLKQAFTAASERLEIVEHWVADGEDPLLRANHMVVALHPCGDLGLAIARSFVNNQSVRYLGMVPCCYHRITVEGDWVWGSGTQCSCLLSDTAKTCIDFPSRRQRMRLFALANSQAASVDAERITASLFRTMFRALAGLIASRMCSANRPGSSLCSGFGYDWQDVIDHINPPRFSCVLPSGTTEFNQYVIENKDAIMSYLQKSVQSGLKREITMADVEAAIESFSCKNDVLANILCLIDYGMQLMPVLQMNMLIATVAGRIAEIALLLDRAFYLFENSINSAIVPIFSRDISPRFAALVGWRVCQPERLVNSDTVGQMQGTPPSFADEWDEEAFLNDLCPVGQLDLDKSLFWSDLCYATNVGPDAAWSWRNDNDAKKQPLSWEGGQFKHRKKPDGDNTQPTNVDDQTTAPDTTSNPFFSTSGNQIRILRGSFGVVTPGRFLGCLGPSGAGKSTLLSLLSGRVQQSRQNTAGTYALNGRRATPEYINSVSGYVEQFPALCPTDTVKEAVMLSCNLRLSHALYTPQERAAVAELAMRFLGIHNIGSTLTGGPQLASGLSGGEFRRVAIAVELVASPKVIFMDEPTTGLDTNAAYSLVALCRAIASGIGSTWNKQAGIQGGEAPPSADPFLRQALTEPQYASVARYISLEVAHAQPRTPLQPVLCKRCSMGREAAKELRRLMSDDTADPEQVKRAKYDYVHTQLHGDAPLYAVPFGYSRDIAMAGQYGLHADFKDGPDPPGHLSFSPPCTQCGSPIEQNQRNNESNQNEVEPREKAMAKARDILFGEPRIVVATIHQPPSILFNLFDLICIIGQGRTVYFGPAKWCVAFLKHCGMNPPLNANPADFLIDVVSRFSSSPVPSNASNRIEYISGKMRVIWQHFLERHAYALPQFVAPVRAPSTPHPEVIPEWDIPQMKQKRPELSPTLAAESEGSEQPTRELTFSPLDIRICDSCKSEPSQLCTITGEIAAGDPRITLGDNALMALAAGGLTPRGHVEAAIPFDGLTPIECCSTQKPEQVEESETEEVVRQIAERGLTEFMNMISVTKIRNLFRRRKNSASVPGSAIIPLGDLVGVYKFPEPQLAARRYQSPTHYQISTLTVRQARYYMRDSVYRIQLLQSIAISFIAATLFFVVTMADETGPFNLTGACFFLLMSTLFGPAIAAGISIVDFRRIFWRETGSYFYRPESFWMARQIVELLFKVVFILVGPAWSYWLIGTAAGNPGLRASAGYYFLFLLVLWATSIATTALSSLVATMTPTRQMATAIVSAIDVLVFTIGGFSIVNVPGWWIWFQKINYFFYAFRLALWTIMNGRIFCVLGPGCRFPTGASILAYYNINPASVSYVGYIFVILGSYLIFAVLGLFIYWKNRFGTNR